MNIASTGPAPPESASNTRPQVQPLDAHNRQLLSNAHPADWVNPTPQDSYNLIVIGAGTAGLVTAAGAAGLGAKVALIERSLMGGDCLNVGCVPSKALIRSARAAADLRHAERFGVRVPPGVVVDFPAVMERMRRLRADISHHDSAERFSGLGVDVFIGNARFTGKNSVEVGGQELRFARACIATGSKAAVPSILGLREAGYLTNETIFSLAELPRRLAVIGAGPIGCELAQAFSRFGSKVFLIESDHGVLPKEDPDASEIVRHALLADGVQLMCCGREMRVERITDGKRLTLESHGTEHDFTVDEILVGVGRTPNIEGLESDAAGVQSDAKGIRVNDFLQTTNSDIYAAGDVCSRYKFTHAADAMARIVIQNSLFFGRKRFSGLIIPWCTYTDPEVAHVGITPREAEEQGTRLDTFQVKLSSVDRAVLDGEEAGFVKIHVRQGTDSILGATLVARHAGEMISEVTLAMSTGRGLKTLSGIIHPYPTQAEAIKKAADAYNRTRLSQGVGRLLKTVMKWRR